MVDGKTYIKEHLKLLGHKVRDAVSDFEGVVVSISFDLYGCVQADVRPMSLNKDGGLKPGYWLDVTRLIVDYGSKPLMDVPDFEWGEVATGKRGPANLPSKECSQSR